MHKAQILSSLWRWNGARGLTAPVAPREGEVGLPV